MTPEQVLSAYRDLVVVNSDQIALEISVDFKKKSEAEQRQFFGGSHQTGFTWIIRSDSLHLDKVMETVVSPTGDAITSLYINHRIFDSQGDLLRARKLLIAAVAQRVGLSPEAAGVDDSGRGRVLSLYELSTGQLVDLLAERMGRSIVVPNNRGGYAVPL